MKILNWTGLNCEQRRSALARPNQGSLQALDERVDDLIRRVRFGGDDALRQLIRELDRSPGNELWVSDKEMAQARRDTPAKVIRAIEFAHQRLLDWQSRSQPQSTLEQTTNGCVLGTQYRAIERVGLYVPAGSAPLPSTTLMLGVPASIAGCPTKVLATPADGEGRVDCATLVAAQMCGIDRVLKAGGAQAIAAMAFGTESVPKVDKIFGPGNAWVTRAKQKVALDPAGAACDLPAGPSEVLVVADGNANPKWVAADLLSQAEHGADSQVIAVVFDSRMAVAIEKAARDQLAVLPRSAIAERALQHARLIVVSDREQALSVVNDYAPEHLILQVSDARSWLPEVRAAGSVFLGRFSPESAGDYASGTNHVLPTGGYARAWSGLSVGSFMNAISVQELSRDGLAEMASAITDLARWEGLEAHARAVDVRLDPELASGAHK